MSNEDPSFRLFAGTLEATIARYGHGNEDEQALLRRQRQQFEELAGLEREFRETLIRCRWGPACYRAFVKKICEEYGHLLTARPYFRERQEVFNGPISKAFKNRHIQSLYPYNFNYNFMAFVMGCRNWPPRGRLQTICNRAKRIRQEIVELNMPLAISQARKFWQKAPAAIQDKRFTFLDFVQVAADGLISAVDKFVMPPAEELDQDPGKLSIWRGVAVGRMRGNFIETFSETSIHFWPQDKRKLYRANKHLKDHPGQIDFDKLAEQVNTDLSEDGIKTTAAELADLMGAATNPAFIDTSRGGEEEDQETLLDRAAASEDWQPDVRYERQEVLHRVQDGISILPLVDRKLLRMKGCHFDSI